MCRYRTKEQLPYLTKRYDKQRIVVLHGQPQPRDLWSNAEPLCAFDSTLKKWNLACRQVVTLMCLDSCTVFFMLYETPPPLSTQVILCNWTSQQGLVQRWLDEKGAGYLRICVYLAGLRMCSSPSQALRSQITPASSWWPQLCSPQPRWKHDDSSCSLPLQPTLSKRMGPDP